MAVEDMEEIRAATHVLISVSGMDPFDVLHTLEGLMAAGLVEIDR